MASCCDPRGCDRFFGARFARRVARRYRKRGLGRTERWMVEFLESAGLEGASVLEVGGGVGELHVELLKRGAGRAVNLELSPAYDEEAERLLADTALEGRVERRLHDIAVDPGRGRAGRRRRAATASSAAIRTTSGCSGPPVRTRGGRWCSATRAATRSRARSSPRRTPASGSCATSSASSPTRPRRCSRVLREHGLEPRFAESGFAWQVTGLAR